MDNLQQIFDGGWNGLKAQGFVKCISFFTLPAQRWEPLGEFGCGTRDNEGRRCVLEHATEALGGYAALGAARDCLTRAARGDADLVALMLCHNDATSPEDMERRMREFAAQHGLTIPGDDAKTDDAAFAAFKAKLFQPVAVTA